MSALPTPRGVTIHARIAAQAALTPDSPALVSDRETLSYRELMRRSLAVAELLRRRGTGVEEPVGVCLERGTDLVVAMLGVLQAGATYLPLDPKYPPERIGFMLDDAQVRRVFTRRELEHLFAGRADSARIERLYIEELGEELAAASAALAEAGGAPAERTFPEALSHLIYTSGSTGRPKGVSICHRNVTTFFDWCETCFPDDELRGVFAATSVCFDLSVFEIYFPLTRGGTVIIGRDALHLPTHPARDRVTLVNTVPSAITELVRQKAIPPGVVTVNLAGEPLKKATTDAVYASSPTIAKVYNLYGPSEDTTYSTWSLVPKDGDEEPTIGYSKDGSEGWILGPQGELLPDGEIGDLHIGGEGVSRGYLGRPVQTAERYVPDPFSGRPGARLYRSGDRVRRRPDGQLEYFGRFDHQVKIRGFRIELGEIEAALARHPSLEMPLALVREDVPGDKRIVAYFQLKPGAPAPDAAGLRLHLADFLPHFMVPSAFVALEKMPLTPNGKIDRNPLMAMAPPETEERDFAAPEGDAEERLALLFAEVLGLDRVGRHDSFLELGGHSLVAARLGARIEEELGVVCDQKAVFEAPTVAGLAAALEGAPPVASAAIPPRDPAATKAPLNAGMRGQLYLWQLDKSSPQYATPVLIRLAGPLDAEALRVAIERLIERHEALRAYFPISEQGFSEVVIAPPARLELPVADLRGEDHPGERAHAAALAETRRGFDLATEPSLRIRLWRTGEQEHYLLVNLHHVVTDGFSMQIFFREMSEIYTGELAGVPAVLPPLPAGLFDTLAHLDSLVERDAEQHMPFWRDLLEGARPVELAADRPRPSQPSHRGDAFRLAVPGGLVEALTKIGARHGASFFLVAYAAFHAFVTRLTGQSDFVLGVPLAGRKHPATRGQVGLFINALPVRVDAGGDPTFVELLGRVRSRQLAAWEHELVPLDRLVTELAPDRQLGRNPFFDLAFQVRDGYFGPDLLPGLAAEHLLVHNGTSKFDIDVALVQRGDTLTAEIDYDLEMFDRATVDRLMESFMGLLEEIAANPEGRLSAFSLVPEGQRAQLDAWQALGGEAPLGSSLAALFRQAATRAPEAPALEYGSERVSYGELDRRSDVLAAALRAAGVRPGDFVALAFERSPRQIAALLAIVKAGAAYVPLDSAYPRERLAFLLEDSGARLLLAEPALAELLPVADFEAAGGRLLLVDDGSFAGAAEPLPEMADSSFPAYLIYTSGSTGRPKGVVVPQRGVIRLAFDNRFLELGPQQRIAQASNVSFDAATFEIWGALLRGGCLVGLERETLLAPEKLRAFLTGKRISAMWLTASLFHQYARQVPDVVASLGALLFGGERCDPAAVRQALELGPKRLINGYGPTETTTFAACYEVHEVPPGAVSVPIGRPIGETELLIVDRWGQRLPIGAAGELWIGGAGLAHGYHRRAGLTAGAFVPHPESSTPGARLYRSGDLVRLRPDGLFDYQGRIDQQVKVRGFRVELGEIETQLGAHPAVGEKAVALQDDGRGSSRLVAYVALKKGAAASADELRGFLGRTLPEYLVPTAYQFLDKLPLTPNGKVDRRALPAFEMEKMGAAGPSRRPGNEIERRVHATWCELFGIDEIDLDARFFSIGGHSLMAAQLLARLKQQFHIDLPLRAIYEQPTIEALAVLIEAQLLEKLLPAAFKPAAPAPAAKTPPPPPVAPAPVATAPAPAPVVPDLTPIIPEPEPVLSEPEPVLPEPEPVLPEPVLPEPVQEILTELEIEAEASSGAADGAAPGHHAEEAVLPLPEGAPLPLSFGQKRLFFLHLLEPEAGTYNMGFAFELRGALDRGALERALSEVVRRHAILRTRYSMGHDGLTIVIDPPAAFRFRDEDLRGLDPASRSARLQQETDDEFRRGFDLQQGPVWRSRLLRLEDELHGFLFTLHHIATDGWSQGILSQEIADLYDAFRQDRPSPLPEPQLQYHDFAAWQERQLAGQDNGRLLEFWRERLAGLEPTELAADFSRQAEQSHRGDNFELVWPLELMPQVKRFSRQNGVSPFVTCLTAFYATLQAFCDRDDLAVGTVAGGRSRPELESVVGFFVNTLVVRTRLEGDPSFAEAAVKVRKSFHEAFEHADLPFDQLVESLLPNRDLARHPFVSILFQVFDRELMPSLPGLESRLLDPFTDTAKMDLAVSILRHESGTYQVACEFAVDLYRKETIAHFFRSFMTLLTAAVSAPETRLSRLPLLDEGQQETWSRLNRTETDAPLGRGLYELFREQVEKAPQQVAIVQGERRLTYRELDDAAARLAGRLAEKGVEAGDVVGLCLERSVERTAAMLATLRLGAAYTPIDPQYPAERLAFLIEDSDAALLLVHSGRLAALPPAARRARALEVGEAELATGDAGPLAADAALPAMVIYTSGSTGRPKGAVIPQSGVVRLVRENLYLELGSGDVLSHLASPSFDAATFEVWAALLNGARIVVIEPEELLDAASFRQVLVAQGVSVVLFTTTLFQLFSRQLPGCFAGVRAVLFGGERCDPEAVRHAITTSGAHIFENVYGPTEDVTFATVERVETIPERASSVPIGPLIGHTRGYLVDRRGRLLPPGAMGELLLGGPALALAYHGRPGLTARSFVPDPFGSAAGERLYRSGDLVRLLPSGAFDYLGRIDEQVKLRGFRLELGEIESALALHPEVASAGALVQADARGEQHLVAYFAARRQPAPDAAELREFLAESLPAFALPSFFVELPELPVSPSGKLDRKRLAARPLVLASATAEKVAPRGLLEQMVHRLWCDLLGAENTGVHDNFFMSGGHSLLAAQLLARLRDQLGVDLRLQTFFRNPTIAGLATSLTEGAAIKVAPGSQLAAGGPQLASFGQRRLFFLYQLDPTSPHYNMPLALELRGPLDAGALAQAIETVVHRHEVLRTRYQASPQGPVLVIDPPAPLALPVEDLSALPEAEREAALTARLDQDLARPFRLEQEPVWRSALLRLAEDRHVLLLTTHHIASDGWSQQVIASELSALYAAYRRGGASPLPPLTLHYTDYANWLASQLSGPLYAERVEFWRARLAGLPFFELPTDFRRPETASNRGGYLELPWPEATAERLRAFARDRGETVYNVLLAALSATLSAFTSQQDFALGTVVGGRPRTELETLVGFFVNTLVLRQDLSGNPSFAELLRRSQETFLDAEANDLPFDKLVEELQPERGSGRNPFVQIVFQLVGMSSVPAFDDLAVELIDRHGGTSKFDLTVIAHDFGHGELVMVAEYASELYRRETIEHLFRSLRVLLDAAMDRPEAPVAELPLLDRRQQDLWRTINRTASGAPLGAGLYRLFRERAELHPERVAVVAGEREVSYGELAASARDIAAGLLAAGVRPGDVVGIALERSPELAACFVAVSAVGATYAPLDPGYPAERLVFMIEDTGMPVLLTRAALAGALPTAGLNGRGGRVLALEDIPAGAAEPVLPRASAATPAMLIYTSGSTGRPKGVVVPQDGVIRLVLDNLFLEIGEDEVFGNVSNPSFDAITFEVWGALLNGGRMVVIDADTLLSPERFRAAIASQGIQVMFLTVALFQQYLRHRDDFFAGMRALFFGGERCDADTVRRAFEKGGTAFYNAYGPTEDTTFAVISPIEEMLPAGVTSAPIGRLIAHTEGYVTDSQGRLLPPGAVGELLLGGAGLATGYFRRPELTARSFVPHPFTDQPGDRLYRTGDLARLLPDGQLEYVGRIDDQVKVRGFRIELGEIESALVRHPGVAAAGAVVGRDSRGDAQLAAYFEPTSMPAPEPAELRAFLAAELPSYLLPSFFIPLPALPISPNGKLDRQKLASLPLEAAASGAERIAPQGPLEKAVHRLWCDLLQVSDAGVEDNFFTAGGHSLLASQLLSRVRDRFGVEVGLRDFFQQPTIAGLAGQLIVGKVAEVADDQPRFVAGSPLTPSFGQRRLFFLYQLDPGSPAYNIPLPIVLRGELDVAALERAIGALLERHEVLRTRYIDGDHGLGLALDPPPVFELPLESLEAVPAAQRDAAALARIDAEMQKPFRLETDAMLRATLLRLGAEHHLLLLTTHHIASDGWSQQLLAEELAALYRAFRRGEGNPLAPLALQYSDYANWLDALLQGERYEKLLGFWRDRLAGLPTLELPTDFPHPEVPTQRGAIHDLQLPVELSEQVRGFARERGETLFVLLLAAFAGTLARYSGQRDFGIGTVVAGRPRTELESMVGFFVNTLVLRQSFAGEPSFDEALRRTRESFLDAQAHQEVPFEKLASELRPERDTSRAPFVQVVFQVAGMDILPRLDGLETGLIHRHGGTAKFDLSVSVTDLGAGTELDVSVEYNTDILRAGSVERLFASFATLLAGALAAPQRNLWRLPLVSPTDLALLDSWGRELPYDASETIPSLLARQAAATPERVALIHEYQEITYRELSARVARLAHLLRRRGVGPETIVGVCLERTPELVVALQAVLFAGGTYLPLDPAYPSERIAGMLEDTQARLLITQESLAPRFAGYELLVVEQLAAELAAESPQLPAPTPGMVPEQIAYLIYTSGSTGRPKGVAITHHNAVAFFAWAATEFSDEELSGVSATVSVCFDVSIFELFFPLTQGGTVILATNVLHVMSLPAREKIKILTTVPSAITELLRLEGIPSSVISIGLPGEPLKHALVQQIFAVSNAQVAYNFYGPSEDTTYSTWARLYRSDTEEPPVGWPIANSRGYVVDAGGELLPPGLMGELYLGGDGVSRGYLRRPRITAERYVPDPFSGTPGARLYRTGDRIRWREDGQLLCFGRFDHQVKLRGFRIELGEIEAVLARHPAVGLTLAMVREDVPGDPRLTAYYTLRGERPSQNELRDYLRQHLPHFMVPAFLVELAEMPLNPNGKTDRAKLPAPQAAAAAGGPKPAVRATPSPVDLAALLPAQDDYEEFLAEQWKAVLHLDEVAEDDNFFDLGGHSLLVPKLAKLIETRFPQVRMLDLFRFPTITKMADHLRGGPRQAAAEAAIPQPAPPLATAGRDVAIVGVAGRFPGAGDVEALWQNVLAGAETIMPLTDEQMLAEGVDAESLALPEYVKRAAVLQGFEEFDADFFAMNAREAQITDPQHRIFLETAWEALERAGWAGEGQDLGSGGRIGVFAGTSQSGYFLHHVLSHPELLQELGTLPAHLGSDKDFLPTRVAYKLDLTGPAFSVQTACSTSLVAVHLACRSLFDGDCDMALAGGATVQVPHRTGYAYVSDSIMSPDGHCRAFDERAAGTVPSSGVGVVVLKRLADAVAAGDHIVAVIRGSAINNDGAAKVGFTAPSVDGQARVISDALGRAGVPARSIGYVETHGTGTQMGDPIEVAALEKVHRRESEDRAYCAISSFKTQVGHMDSAAGVGGLIRAALAVERATIPPNLHFEKANPELRLEQSPFYVPAAARPWPAGGKRRAGVSSFGIGGTNAHLVLEEAPAAPATTAGRPRQLLLLSARSEASLSRLAESLAAHLDSHPALHSPERLADVAATLHRGRRHFPHRLAVVAQDGAEAAALLRDPARTVRGQAGETPQVAFLFPGQGSQYAGMGRELYENEPVFRREIDACAEKLQPLLGLDLRPLLLARGEQKAEAQEKLQATGLAQPALFVIEWSLASLWLSWGVVPSELIGHSIGEYVAATLAGVFERDAALELVALRGRLMQSLPEGAMLAVRLPESAVFGKLIAAGLAERIAIAAINGPGDVVVSGPRPAIEAFAAALAKAGSESRELKTSHAFHSPMMEPILEEFRQAVARANPQKPRRPFLSNLTGAPIDAELAISPEYWARHLRHAVRFADGLGHLLAQPRQILLEVGPGRALGTLARRVAGPDRTILASLPHPQDERGEHEILLETVARLYSRGAKLAGDAFYAGQKRRRLALPTTPFERRRFWLEARAPQGFAPATAAAPLETPIAAAGFAGPAPAEITGTFEPPQLDPGPVDSPAAAAAPADEVAVRIEELWRNLLGADEPIPFDLDFYEAGGDSLMATQLANRMRKVFEVAIRGNELMADALTIADQAELVRRRQAARQAE